MEENVTYQQVRGSDKQEGTDGRCREKASNDDAVTHPARPVASVEGRRGCLLPASLEIYPSREDRARAGGGERGEAGLTSPWKPRKDVSSATKVESPSAWMTDRSSDCVESENSTCASVAAASTTSRGALIGDTRSGQRREQPSGRPSRNAPRLTHSARPSPPPSVRALADRAGDGDHHKTAPALDGGDQLRVMPLPYPNTAQVNNPAHHSRAPSKR